MKLLLIVCLSMVLAACGKKNGPDQPVTTNPSISIKPVTLSRNNASTTTFPFTVILNKVSSKDIKVDYKTVDSTANNTYFTEKSGTLTIPAGQTLGEIDIPVRSDSLRETNKIFLVEISNAVNATIAGGGKAAGTIICDGTYIPVDNAGYIGAFQLFRSFTGLER